MARLPVIEGQRQLTTDVATFKAVINRQVDRSKSEGYARQAEAFKMTQDLIAKWQEASDLVKYTAAKANYEANSVDIMNRAEADADYTAAEKYMGEYDRLAHDILKDIPESPVKNRVKFELEKRNQMAKIKIANIYRNKAIDYTKKEFLPKAIEALNEKRMNAYSEKEFMDADRDIKNLIKEQISKGIISGADGDKLYLSAQKALIDYDIMARPEVALAELQKGNHGLYKGVATQDRIKYMKTAEKRLEQVKKNKKAMLAIARDETESALLDEKYKGTLTPTKVENLAAEGEISRVFADALISSLTSIPPIEIGPVEKMTKYVELTERADLIQSKIEGWFSEPSFEEVTQFRADVLTAESLGYITHSQSEGLVSKTAEAIRGNEEFKRAVNQLKAYSSMYDDEHAQIKVKAEMYESLIKKVQNGAPPEQALKEVVREKVSSEISEAAAKRAESIRGRLIAQNETGEEIYSDDNGKTWYYVKTGKRVE